MTVCRCVLPPRKGFTKHWNVGQSGVKPCATAAAEKKNKKDGPSVKRSTRASPIHTVWCLLLERQGEDVSITTVAYLQEHSVA